MILMVTLWFGWRLGPDVAIIISIYIDYVVRVGEKGAWCQCVILVLGSDNLKESKVIALSFLKISYFALRWCSGMDA